MSSYTRIITSHHRSDYYKGGLSPVSALIIDDYDRAAPRGVGHVKVSQSVPECMRTSQFGRDQMCR